MSRSRSALSRITAAAALALAASTAAVHADDTKTVYSVSAGYEFSSHFISYGADVWGGGGSNWEPWSPTSTMFGYTTVTAAITDQFSLSLNVWADLNNNAESSIGDWIQEVDINLGASYTIDRFTLSAAVGQWMYANDIEGIFDFTVGFDDSDLLIEGFGFQPYAVIHYRWDPNGGQEDDAAAFVLGIAPSWQFLGDTQYPITVTVPASVAFFTDEFQGGDSGFGYATIGVSADVPLAFIPPEYGSWTGGLSVTYYHTDEDAIPGNPQDNFIVTALKVNVAF